MTLLGHFNRLEDYITIIQGSENTTAETVTSIATTITETANNILQTAPSTAVVDDVYELLGDIESVLLCYMDCGGDPTEIVVCIYDLFCFVFLSFHFFLPFLQSDNVQVGASLNTLEDLQTIQLGKILNYFLKKIFFICSYFDVLGGLTFTLPENLAELQESVGGVGTCVSVGYSLIDLQQDDGISLFDISNTKFVNYLFISFFRCCSNRIIDILLDQLHHW